MTSARGNNVAKLDKTRDYGEIIGSGSDAHYFQDGLYFDAQGEEIAGLGTKKKAAAAPKKADAPVTDSAAQTAAQLGECLDDVAT